MGVTATDRAGKAQGAEKSTKIYLGSCDKLMAVPGIQPRSLGFQSSGLCTAKSKQGD